MTFLTKGQSTHDGLIGVYESTSNGFEKYSIIILDKDNRFAYKAGLGGCQVEVKGTWIIEKKKLKLTNDNEFLNKETVYYPNLGLTTWTITRNGIKPDGLVDSGCVKDDKLHRRR
ncbi:hypothetical protein DR864_11805 [Runella rosea]|uniref:Lipocalin-like domain-containing protein n=1 Tax=Runella rosea TaxID=2259595 RepID=A0A344TIB2_9BACT|nr:hypothetical protein [Runella rosea]AXE18383.1 hypothetical protein DR864_11805 [Runella rosea]